MFVIIRLRTRQFAQTVLFWGGLLALVYCGAYYLESYLFQRYENQRFEEARSSPLPELSTRHSLSEGSVLGKIEIPRLGVSVMVVEGVTDTSLKLAAGHIPGTAFPGQIGNMGIAGHRDTFFRNLRHVRKDDVITVTTWNGIARYSVESTRIVAPSAVEVLNPSSQSVLTLVTCYPFYFVGPAPRRFIVRARQVTW